MHLFISLIKLYATNPIAPIIPTILKGPGSASDINTAPAGPAFLTVSIISPISS